VHRLRLQALSSHPEAPPPETGTGERRKYLVLVAIAVALGALAVSQGLLSSTSAIFFAVLIPSVILHEISHGVVALAFGDGTAKEAGRLTLNPVPHIDPFGTVLLPAMMVLSGGGAFGYAKPVPVTPARMRKPRGHSLLVSLAGPATNIALVVLLTVAVTVWSPAGLARQVLLTAGLANVILAVFNLIPLPPLDGSAVVERFLPERWLVGWFKLRQYSMLILLALFVLRPGAFARVIRPAVELWAGFVT
jgi:Zn-dependent protease